MKIEFDVEEFLELVGLMEAAIERLRELASESLEWRPLTHKGVKVGEWRKLPSSGEGWLDIEIRPMDVEIERWEDHRLLWWLWKELKSRVDGRLEVRDGALHIHLQPGDDETDEERERRLEATLRMAAWALWALRR